MVARAAARHGLRARRARSAVKVPEPIPWAAARRRGRSTSRREDCVN
jgi:hypothetical protein